MQACSRRCWLNSVACAVGAALLPAALTHAIANTSNSTSTSTSTTLPPELAAEFPGARLQGQGRLRFLGLRVYDAKLWVGAQAITENTSNFASLPFALELDYERNLKGKQVAERSLEEMKRQGEVAEDTAKRWLATMETLFPDIKKGDRLSALNVPGMGARFFMNGNLRGDVRDADFVRLFFGIWLSPKTSEPALREALLGRAAP
jgi:Chalcone isomerase-like